MNEDDWIEEEIDSIIDDAYTKVSEIEAKYNIDVWFTYSWDYR